MVVVVFNEKGKQTYKLCLHTKAFRYNFESLELVESFATSSVPLGLLFELIRSRKVGQWGAALVILWP